MKFLCVQCDEQMKLHQTVAHEDIGSLSGVFACPTCGNKIAMLTNPAETQLVTSLGIRLGNTDQSGAEQKASKCPFANMLAGTSEQQPQADIRWSAAAEERLERIPEFIRPMARMGIEKYALEQGIKMIDEEVLGKARTMFGIE